MRCNSVISAVSMDESVSTHKFDLSKFRKSSNKTDGVLYIA